MTAAASLINLNTAATSRSSLAFNSICEAPDGETYALNSTGLVRIDDSATTNAEVTFGLQDFGTSALKYCPTAYAGISAAKRMGLDVVIEGKTYIYYIRDYSTTLQQQRFDLGKGLRANWYSFRLYNTAGGAFSLADFTLMPQASTRRI